MAHDKLRQTDQKKSTRGGQEIDKARIVEREVSAKSYGGPTLFDNEY
jgi:hypothetical protein